MKKINLLTILFIIVSVLFVGSVEVRAAFPTSLGKISQSTPTVTDDCGGASCFGMGIKYSASQDLANLCTDYDKFSPAKGGGVSCELNNDWNTRIRASVAAVIDTVKGNIKNDEMTPEYFAAELAINTFLNQKGISGREIKATSLSSKYSSLFTNYVSIANAAYDNYSEPTISLSTKTLTFKKDNDNYISNTITVNSNTGGYNVTANVGNVVKNGNSFYISVPASSVNASTTIEVSVSNSKTISQARNYTCGGADSADYQTVTPVMTENIELTSKDSASGKITPLSSLIIKKVDSNGNYLAGATIKVENSDKSYSKTFETTNAEIKITDLPYGEYTITEVSAPNKYVNKDESKKVVLSESNLTETVVITNELVKIEITKVSAEDDKPLEGAELHIEDKDGKVIESWTTNGTAHIVEGLEYGTYYLVEDSAPEGFVLNNKKTEFKVDGTKDLIKIQISNELTSVEISKVSAANDKELKGATLQVLDKDKNKMSCTVRKGSKDSEVLDECTWVSGEESKVILGLKPGKYYLVETIAPEGYVLNESAIEFEVKEDGTTDPVVMKNELEVKVPDTLSSKSALLLAIAMFDIALGIGIVTYVKKNRTQE